ncbi:MAG: DUF5681 domain-containing protein [Cystobacterineae bacterium]|nr:DUF5681 domain-containing protein [Cystobacterineae bacterium]
MPRFKPGQSGNPAGRRKGSINRQLAALREVSDKVLPLVTKKALAGDFDAQKLILERALPRMKALSPPEAFSLPEGDLLSQVQAVLRQVAAGELSPTVAAEVASVAASIARVKEVDIQARQPQMTQADCERFARERLAELRARRKAEEEEAKKREDEEDGGINVDIE